MKLSGPIQYVWSHGEKYVAGFTCSYCDHRSAGGGATRFREHLGGIPGSVLACEKVPDVVKTLMVNQVTERRIRTKKGRKLRMFVEKEIMQANRCYGVHDGPRIPPDEEAQFQMAVQNSLAHCSGAADGHRFGSGSGGGSCSASHQSTLDKFYRSPQSVSKEPLDIDLARSKTQVQRRVDVMLTAGTKEKLGKSWAKWFHANDIPGRKADCPYFRSALKLTQQLGEGVQIPRGREIDGPLLDMNYEELEANMAAFKEDWDDFGVTIMCDSWTGNYLCTLSFNFTTHVKYYYLVLVNVNLITALLY